VWGCGDDWRDAIAAHRELLRRLDRRFEVRFEALGEIERVLGRLHEITSPHQILRVAPELLCAGSDYRRVVLGLLRDGSVVAFAVHFVDDPDGSSRTLERLSAVPIRLEHPIIEADVVRRRRATIVSGVDLHPRVHRPTAEVMGWSAYGAAPLVVGEEVIGILHADTGTDGRPLDVLDGDVLWAFARGVSDGYETASLRRSLRRHRLEMTEFVEWLSARSRELSEVSIELVPDRPQTPRPPGPLDLVGLTPAVDDRLAFAHLLTRRELDVLRLLARGDTNAAIADKLVISETTVKFHVVNLLAKLRVANRAEAVARYHRIVRSRGQTDAPSAG
jgi:LuxR family transcriptional regulator, regulator of acetate metabolism